MWDKETSKSNKNDDTPAEGSPENTISECTKKNDMTQNAAVESDTLVVATYVDNDEGDSAGSGGVVDASSAVQNEPSDINQLLSIVRLCDGPSTSTQEPSDELHKTKTSTCVSNVTANIAPPSVQSVTATAPTIKETTSSSALTVAIDCDELPYATSTSSNSKTQSSQQSPKPTISVKCFSPMLRVQTIQNETLPLPNVCVVTERRKENSESDNVAGPQMQSSNDDNPICLPAVADLDRGTRAAMPEVTIEELTSASESRAPSPANSSVTSVSTPRASRSAIGRRVVCLRHIRRAPKEPEEYMDALFPHIREAHNQIRKTLLHSPLTDVKDNALLKRKMFEVIRHYISGCKNEFERVTASLILCRRLKRNIIRLLDLFHDICSSSREDPAYLYHISQLIAVYNSLEIKLSFNLTRLQKCALIHRIAHIINKHLLVKDESLAKENVLRMFLHMPDMYSARFIMEPLFNTFLAEIPTSNNTRCQRELPDKKFVQYIIVLHLWKEMLRNPLEQVELINRAQHFMCPTKTLHTNPMYVNHLPTIHTRKHAVKDILNSLKYFHDLKNAAICDDTLEDGDDDIEVVIDDVINATPLWDFGATYAAGLKHQKRINRRAVTPEPLECVDLTLEDEQPSRMTYVEHSLDWLKDLKERASERVQADETEMVICLDSDSDGELFSGSILDPTESYQDCDAVDTDYTSLDSSTTDDKAASEDDALTASGIAPNGLRTYLAPKSKKQFNSSDEKHTTSRQSPYVKTTDDYGVDESESEGASEGGSVTAGKKPSTSAAASLPLIVNTFTVNGKQNMHLLNSPRFSLDIGPERFGNEDMEFHDTCEGKVIYSQPLSPSNRRLLMEDNANGPSDRRREFERKIFEAQDNPRISECGSKQLRLNADDKPVKKQVKFNDNPIGPTRRLNTKLPIKPAIHLSKTQTTNQQPAFPNSPQPRFTSPSSSTSSTTESLKQMAQKERISAIATLFSGYKIKKPSLAHSTAMAKNSGSKTTLAGSKIKSTHNSRETNTAPGPSKRVTISPQTFSSPLSAQRNSSTSPVSVRTNNPIITTAEVATDPKLHKKCAVVMQENEEVLKYKKQEIAFINDLLEKQREMQRQRAFKRQEFQNILKQKREEDKRLMAEIVEIKRQRGEAQEKSLLAQEQEAPQRQQQPPSILNRKRMLVKERKIKLKAKTAAQSRSTAPNRMAGSNGQSVLEAAENKKGTAVRKATKVHVLKLTAGADPKVDVAKDANNMSAMGKQGNMAATVTYMPAGIGNDAGKTTIELAKRRANSESEDTAVGTFGASSTQMQTPEMSSKSLKTGDLVASYVLKDQKHGTTPKWKNVVEAASKTSLSEKPKISQVAAATIPTSHTRQAKSMTPTRTTSKTPTAKADGNAAPTRKGYARKDLLINSSHTFSSPTSSRMDLLRAPSLSPSIFRNRIHLEVRRSMQDPSSNSDFPSNAPSWLLNSSPRTLTKTVKVRLKRLQHLNMNFSSSSSSDKTSNLRPASTIPVYQNENGTKEQQLDAKRSTAESVAPTLELEHEKIERAQKLKERIKTQWLEMDEKLGAGYTNIVENVITNTSKGVTPKPPSPTVEEHDKIECSQKLKERLKTQWEMDEKYSANVTKYITVANTSKEETPKPPSPTVEGRAKKAIRRKMQRKQQQVNHSKKMKLSEKPSRKQKKNKTQQDIASKECKEIPANVADSAKLDVNDGGLCSSNKSQSEKKTFSLESASENKNVTESLCKTPVGLVDTAEDGGGDYRRENSAQQEVTEQQSSKNDECAPSEETLLSSREENSPNVPMAIDGSNIVEKHLKGKHTHGAIVTQVVDVTPGRHIKDSLLSDLILATAATRSLVPKSSESCDSATMAVNAKAPAIDLTSAEQVEEGRPTPLSAAFPSAKPSSPLTENLAPKAHEQISNEMVAAAASLTMLANTTKKPSTALSLISHELQNENGDSLLATGIILPKRPSCDSFSSNIQIVPDPPTVIGLQKESNSRCITPIDGHDDGAGAGNADATQNTKPLTVKKSDEFVRTASTVSDDEESSSDCLLSQLSRHVHKMSDLESIVEPTTVHVIKGATMTLMSFEATPTLPTYLLNGESRDVPTPPAVAISAPTPLPIPNADVSPDTDEQRHTETPTTALIAEPAKNELPLTPTTQNSKERMAAELPQPDSLAIASVPVKEPEQVSVKDLPSVAAPVLAEQDVGKFSDRSSHQSLTPPLQLGQQFQDAMNSPPPSNAVSISSDHEVSSTQELVFTPEKRSNSNTLNKSADVSTPTIVEETAMVVQNSQIDTTHHLPENSYHMRRRTRKFSDESILHENRNDDPANNVPQRRRKTFSSESTLHVQFTSNTISTPNVNTLTSSIATSGTSVGLNSGGGGVGGVGGGSGGSSPSTTTEPVTKPAQTRRRNHTQKRNISQLPLSARSRGGRGVGSASESNGTFVFGCSRLQTSKVHLSDVEPCVVLPASAVVPPVNLGNIAHTYSKDSMAQIKVFVPPAVDMCMENEGAEKNVTLKASKISGTEATTTSRRGRPPGSLNKGPKKPKLIESAEKTKARKTAVNLSKPKTARAVNNPVNKPVVAKELQKLQNLKAVQPARPPPAPVKSKTPARTKKADRVSSRKRK